MLIPVNYKSLNFESPQNSCLFVEKKNVNSNNYKIRNQNLRQITVYIIVQSSIALNLNPLFKFEILFH